MSQGFKLIKEYSKIEAEQFLEEGTDQKQWKFRGITLQSEVQNQNRRVYPMSVLREAVDSHRQLMQEGRCLGELNHPDGNATSIDYKEVSHKFTNVFEDGNNFITEAVVLDTPNGRIVKNLLENGVKLGISSRGLGSVKESEGKTIVEKLKLITFGDIVSDPSAPDAFLEGIYEGAEWVYENGIYIGKDIPVDEYSKALKEAKKKDLEEVSKKLLKKYMHDLFG